MRRLLALLIPFLLLSYACGEEGATPPSSTDATSDQQATGSVGAYSWSLNVEDRDGRRCVIVDVQPSILAATDQGSDVDEFLDGQLWDPPACTTGPSTDVDQFEPLFGPYVYVGDRYDLPVVSGLAADDAENITVEYTDRSEPLEILDNGGFILFPESTPLGMTLQVHGDSYACPIESTVTPGGMMVGACVRSE